MCLCYYAALKIKTTPNEPCPTALNNFFQIFKIEFRLITYSNEYGFDHIFCTDAKWGSADHYAQLNSA